jgi:hypothetical protein
MRLKLTAKNAKGAKKNRSKNLSGLSDFKLTVLLAAGFWRLGAGDWLLATGFGQKKP